MSANQSIKQAIKQAQSTTQSINQSNHQSINQSNDDAQAILNEISFETGNIPLFFSAFIRPQSVRKDDWTFEMAWTAFLSVPEVRFAYFSDLPAFINQSINQSINQPIKRNKLTKSYNLNLVQSL